MCIFRSDLEALIPLDGEIELKPCNEVYYAASRFISLFKENSTAHSLRLERLCRYFVASLDSESPKLNYIGVALNKELSLSWIRHIKLFLYYCCVCMDKLKPGMYKTKRATEQHVFKLFLSKFTEIHSESLTLAMYLHTLVSFTSPNTWAILRAKSLAGLKPGMSQLCNNILGALVQKGFFQHLKVCCNIFYENIEKFKYSSLIPITCSKF